MQQIANMIQTETHICKLILNYFSINAPISNYLSFLAIISWFKLQREWQFYLLFTTSIKNGNAWDHLVMKLVSLASIMKLWIDKIFVQMVYENSNYLSVNNNANID